MNNIKTVVVLVIFFLFSSCSKQEQKINTENQSSTQNVKPEETTGGTQDMNAIVKQWAGQYSFEESAKNVTGQGAQSWNYVVDVKAVDDKTLTAIIQIDGFQTMTRIEAEVKASDKNAAFYFNKYGAENVFEIYKKGDLLFTLVKNDNNEIITNWDRMKPNVLDNQKNGKVMFRKAIS
ncbi:MAG: hypothetical protein K8I03_05860 [Ignavibacteria bacterium]|nr:hypothetical protein [Ignavibacteria bacterium]